MSKHYACYCMTRNIYHKVLPSLRSLLAHSDAEVFLLTEDDDVGFSLPDRVHVVNVSGQKWFPESGVNYHNHWTWMVLMRTALCKVFPEIDVMLSLDLDTIVCEDISEIWDTPIGDNYLAACPEPRQCRDDFVYINGGVVLWNLKQMRDGMADRIIDSLNREAWLFPDQNCVSTLCQGRIYHLRSMYNVCNYTRPTPAMKIRHFAAERGWYEDNPLVMDWKRQEGR